MIICLQELKFCTVKKIFYLINKSSSSFTVNLFLNLMDLVELGQHQLSLLLSCSESKLGLEIPEAQLV